ncbi:MAG: hypothetical protein NT046_00530 [Arenimonas sp.]|nr:hypothetical protein [Arenimonas sp.]
MESQIKQTENNNERLPYSKPQLTVFGEVRSLTASGSQMGDENAMSINDLMIMV